MNKHIYRVSGILDNSTVNGKGLRTVIFFSGCPHHCKGCQNASLQDYNAGEDITLEDLLYQVTRNMPYISGITLSGGDPFEQDLTLFLKAIKEIPTSNGKPLTVWAYTGYTIEELQTNKHSYWEDMLRYIDVVVDGKFELEKSENPPKYVGSSNQRFVLLNQGKICSIRNEI